MRLANTGLQTLQGFICLHSFIVSVHDPPRLYFDPLAPEFYLIANPDPDPAFHSNADPDPDPASQYNDDPIRIRNPATPLFPPPHPPTEFEKAKGKWSYRRHPKYLSFLYFISPKRRTYILIKRVIMYRYSMARTSNVVGKK